MSSSVVNRSRKPRRTQRRSTKALPNNNFPHSRDNQSGAQLLALYQTRQLNFRPCEVLPDHFRTSLTYYEQIAYVASNTPQLYVFRGNGPYDPNQTGSGAQPVGWDNLATFYTSSYVIGSKLEILVCNNSTSPLQLAVSPCITSSLLSTYDAARLYPHSKTMMLDGTGRGGVSYKQMSSSKSTLDMWNEPYDRDFTSLVTDVPLNQWFWITNFQSVGQAFAISADVQFRVTYDVIFTGRKLVALS